MSEKKTISVMIPCYNEEQNARPIYEAVRDELVKSCPNYDYEILFIDNKSEDGTRAIIRQICAEDKHVKAIFNVKNFGQFNSPYYGMIHTSGDCTITMCADFQDPVEMIPRFVAEWEKGYKIVIGRKTQSKENPVMYWLRGCYYKLIKKMSSCEQIEQFTGFGLYDKSFIQTLRNLKDPTPFIRGIVAELGPERKEIEYTQPQRRAGKTHNNWYSLYDAAMLSFTSYTKAGMRIATFADSTFGHGSPLRGVVVGPFRITWHFFSSSITSGGIAQPSSARRSMVRPSITRNSTLPAFTLSASRTSSACCAMPVIIGPMPSPPHTPIISLSSLE